VTGGDVCVSVTGGADQRTAALVVVLVGAGIEQGLRRRASALCRRRLEQEQVRQLNEVRLEILRAQVDVDASRSAVRIASRSRVPSSSATSRRAAGSSIRKATRDAANEKMRADPEAMETLLSA
jgi:hypothetical protein